jgi:hypothetical protein
MATYNKFNDFVEQLCAGKHDLTAAGHVCRLALSNAAPVATNTIFANITEITSGNGYTAGGEDAQNQLSESPAGTALVEGVKVVWTGGPSPMATFRYVVLYNDTQTSPVDPLIAWWDHGSAVTLNNGDTFTVLFNNEDPTGDIFTLT